MRRAILREYRQQHVSQRIEAHREDEWHIRVIGYLGSARLSLADAFFNERF